MRRPVLPMVRSWNPPSCGKATALENMKTMTDKPEGQQPRSSGKLPTPQVRRGLGSFFKDLKREARQVTWPTPQETTRLTGTVIAVCALVAGFLFILGFLVQGLFRILGVQ